MCHPVMKSGKSCTCFLLADDQNIMNLTPTQKSYRMVRQHSLQNSRPESIKR